MLRTARQNKILEIISKTAIETQDELVANLRNSGFQVTQATVSRDIKELRLVKSNTDGKQKYVQETHNNSADEKLIDMFRNSLISAISAGNLVIIRTLAASANVAAAMIDKLSNPDILGCIAGDDTIFVACKDELSAKQVCAMLQSLIS